MKVLLSRHRLSTALLLVLLFVLAACSGPNQPPPPSGSLEVIVEGLPSGAQASISVTGPDGNGQAITASTTLHNLSPGSYRITAANVSHDGRTYLPNLPSQDVAVAASSTATARVSYASQERGNLSITITGLPEGTAANVAVSGPGGFSRSVTSSQTLNDLTPGDYTVTAGSVSAAGLGYLPSLTTQTVNVGADATATATVGYAVETGNLQLGVSGLPAGANAAITVTGPGDYSQNVGATTVLTGLVPGTYTISAGNVTSDGNSYIPDPLSREVSITANTTVTAMVTYVRQDVGTGSLAVTITGLPEGTAANVSVSGPNGFSRSVTTSATFVNVAPGSYTIAAGTVSRGGNAYTPSAPTQTVAVGADATATATVSYSAQPGTLQVNITGLPAGVTADVTVTGPNGFNQSVSASTTLSNLSPGSYTISAGNMISGGNSYTPNPGEQSRAVTSNATATATVNYVRQTAGTGTLQLSIGGLPASVTADVSVTGPNGFSRHVTASTTLSSLSPGNYTITAGNVTSHGNSYVPAPATTAMTISAGSTSAASITYALQPGALAITIGGLPESIEAEVVVTGPGGYRHDVTATTTLSGLTPGEYLVVAANVTVADDSYVPNPPQAVTVTSNATATIAVTYVRQDVGTGSLAVAIGGLPEGTLANVTVTGPDGFSESVTSTRTLTGLTPGDYTIAATNVTDEGIAYASSPAIQTARVSAGTTASAAVVYNPQPGSLQVNISGLPAGMNADVIVTGPGGFDQSVSSTRTLENLPPGSYTISANSVISGGDTYVPNPPQQSQSVTSGATATATVSYEPQPPETGSLAITITGLPAGTDAAVTVTGPDDYSESVTASRTLTDLTPGNYTITVSNVTVTGTTYQATPPTQEIAVAVNETATAAVTYAEQPSPPDCVDPVNIPDGALRAVILEALGKSSGDITCAEMLSLESISARNSGIANLEGLQHARNLTELDLFGNAISDISPLAGLTSLTSLSLTANQIGDISPLADLTSLTSLGLVRNRIGDISPLASLTNLTSLGLEANLISDISPLADLTDLSVLNLYANQIGSIASLANLTGLRSLNLGGNEIGDISPLASLTTLTSLSLYGNQIRNLSPLANLTALAFLHLGTNEIGDISPLVQNHGLGEGDVIDLSHNCLDLTAGSQDKDDVDALVQRGAEVHDTPQRDLSRAPCGGPGRGPPVVPGEHLLTVERAGGGDGAVISDPPGIDCGEDCTEAYAVGTEVTLTAHPAENFRFDGWDIVGGDQDCSEDEPSCVVTMDAPMTVTARFVAIPRRGPPSP